MDGVTCDWCSFDARSWSRQDLLGTLGALGSWWRELTRWIDPDLLAARPEPGRWSALEYAAHSRDVIATAVRLESLRSCVPQPRNPGLWDAGTKGGSFAEVVDDLEGNARHLAEQAAGEEEVADAVLADVVHDATHHLMDAGRGFRRLGAEPAQGTGTVVQLSRSDGGVPKLALPSATIGHHGLGGDRQASRKHHGRPWQALCLWSLDVIERLRAEGHRVAPGAAGENVTIAGVDWTSLRPGVRLQVGEALVETSLYALPCAKNAQWFVDGDFRRMGHERERGVSRIYAWVLRGGTVSAGDQVVVEP